MLDNKLIKTTPKPSVTGNVRVAPEDKARSRPESAMRDTRGRPRLRFVINNNKQWKSVCVD